MNEATNTWHTIRTPSIEWECFATHMLLVIMKSVSLNRLQHLLSGIFLQIIYSFIIITDIFSKFEKNRTRATNKILDCNATNILGKFWTHNPSSGLFYPFSMQSMSKLQHEAFRKNKAPLIFQFHHFCLIPIPCIISCTR